MKRALLIFGLLLAWATLASAEVERYDFRNVPAEAEMQSVWMQANAATATPVTLGPIIYDFELYPSEACSPTCTPAWPPSTATGDVIVYEYSNSSAAQGTKISSISGSCGTWHANAACLSQDSTAGASIDMAWCLAATGSGAQTPTVTLSANDATAHVSIFRFKGGSGSYSLDSSGCTTLNHTATASAYLTASNSPTGAAPLIFSTIYADNNTIPNYAAVTNASGSGATNPIWSPSYTGGSTAGPVELTIGQSAGTYQASIATSPNDDWASSTIAIDGMSSAGCLDESIEGMSGLSNGVQVTSAQLNTGLVGMAGTWSTIPTGFLGSTAVGQQLNAALVCDTGTSTQGSNTLVIAYPATVGGGAAITFTPSHPRSSTTWSLGCYFDPALAQTISSGQQISYCTIISPDGDDYVDIAIKATGSALTACLETSAGCGSTICTVSSNVFTFFDVLFDEAGGTHKGGCYNATGTLLGSDTHAALTGHPLVTSTGGLGLFYIGASGGETFTGPGTAYMGIHIFDTTGAFPVAQ